tara:strand:+ start:1008 stop:1667 length:660 start_codon:yes stop_codon:yes gene_type:complete
MFNIICVKFGNKYSSDFVNKLYMDFLSYNPLNPFKFHCYTDDPEGIHDSINIVNPVGPTLKGVWNKLALFSEEFPIKGKNIYLDLDVCIQGDIIEMLENDNHDWNRLHLVYTPWKDNKKRYGRLSSYDVVHHSSVMIWESNVHDIWEHFNSGLRDYFMRKYVGIDRFLAHEDIEVKYLPEHMTVSKKYENRLNKYYRPIPVIATYEELDVQISDLLPCN